MNYSLQVQFHDLGSTQSNLDAARMKVKDVAGKMWSGYLTMEKKGQAGTKETVNISVSFVLSETCLWVEKPIWEFLTWAEQN